MSQIVVRGQEGIVRTSAVRTLLSFAKGIFTNPGTQNFQQGSISFALKSEGSLRKARLCQVK